MAEFKEVVKQFNRMCKAQQCNRCPLNNKRDVFTCWRALTEHPDEMEEAIMRWAEDNPVKTNHQKFEETFGVNPLLILWNINGKDWLTEEYKEPKRDE